MPRARVGGSRSGGCWTIAALTSFACLTISRVLGLSSSRPPSRDQGLTDLGMDSLMAVELSNRLGRGLGLRLPSTLVFEHSTVQELARYLVQQLGIDTSSGPAEPGERAQDSDVADMSDDDLSSALLDELGQIGY